MVGYIPDIHVTIWSVHRFIYIWKVDVVDTHEWLIGAYRSPCMGVKTVIAHGLGRPSEYKLVYSGESYMYAYDVVGESSSV